MTQNRTTPTIAIIDIGMGNLYSVEQAITYAGGLPKRIQSASELSGANGAILPGVGAFGSAIQKLKSSGLDNAIRSFVDDGFPMLGICLGMQLLAETSSELGEHEGLGIFHGKSVSLKNITSQSFKTPNMGWTEISLTKQKPSESIFSSAIENTKMYFAHSFYVSDCDVKELEAEVEIEGNRICAALAKNKIFGCQFHPEKSGQDGITIYRNFVNICKN